MLHKLKRLALILPEATLEASKRELKIYWSRFKEQFPNNEVFERLSPEQLQYTIPIKLHGDEGRSILLAITQFL